VIEGEHTRTVNLRQENILARNKERGHAGDACMSFATIQYPNSVLLQ
jgi:hypothetical protein